MIIIGAGGHAKVVIDALNLRYIDIYDDRKIGRLWEHTIWGTTKDLIEKGLQGCSYHVAIGDNFARRAINKKLTQSTKGIEVMDRKTTIIHPKATVSDYASIGAGTFVAAGVVVGPDAVIGEGCIINHGATVDHDCRLGDYVHVCPGAHLAGGVNIGEGTMIGIGASITQGAYIGDWCLVGAGAAVVCSLTQNDRTIIGVPARYKD